MKSKKHKLFESISISSQSKGNMSKTLLDEKTNQISDLIETNPLEAVSIAVKLWEDCPDDDRAVKLWLKSIILAKTRGGKDLATNAALRISYNLAEKDFCDPEAYSLYLACKILMLKPLTKQDISSFKRANHINPRITNSIVGEVISIARKDQATLLKQTLES